MPEPAPAPGDPVIEGTMLPISVEATDDIAVAVVDFLVNGQVVFTDTTAPYQFTLAVPMGAVTLTLGARVTDFGGSTGVAQDVVVDVSPDPPPTVTLTSPAEGVTVTEGETITLSADAGDMGGGVVSVQFTANGVSLPLNTLPPFSVQFRVPLRISSLTVGATASDTLGQTATATRTVVVVPDPGTTVTGRIVDPQGNPLAGASVTCLGVSGVTGADGTFSIAGIPPVQGAAVVDLNSDGTPDVITASLFFDDVSVLLGNGEGTFQPRQRFTVGSRPGLVAVADLNGDTRLDLVTANDFSDYVAVLLHR